MTQRMSCSMTIDAVRNRTKTVTRRHVDSWQDLQAGDQLTLIEKGRGLKKGEKQVVLAEVEIVDVRVEEIVRIGKPGEVDAEGFPGMEPTDFALMWLGSHGYRHFIGRDRHGPFLHTGWVGVRCRRIEWRYLP